jgi:hypothetical protein
MITFNSGDRIFSEYNKIAENSLVLYSIIQKWISEVMCIAKRS